MSHVIRLNSDRARETARQLVTKAPEGFVVTIAAPKRTSAQNRLLWDLLDAIAAADPLGRGYDREGYKVVAMASNGFKPDYLIGTEGEIIPLGYRSSKLTKPQMTVLIDWLHWFAATHGVVLSEAA